jgi:hypothetical protein
MTTIGFGRPVRDVVCLVAAQGRGTPAGMVSPRPSRRPARPSRSPMGERQALSLAACHGSDPTYTP